MKVSTKVDWDRNIDSVIKLKANHLIYCDKLKNLNYGAKREK